MCWTNLYPLNGIFFVVCASVWNTYLLFIPLLLECYHFILDEKASRFMNFAQLSTGQGCLRSFLNALHFKWVKKILSNSARNGTKMFFTALWLYPDSQNWSYVSDCRSVSPAQDNTNRVRLRPRPPITSWWHLSALVSDIKWFEVVCQPGGRYCVEFII